MKTNKQIYTDDVELFVTRSLARRYAKYLQEKLNIKTVVIKLGYHGWTIRCNGSQFIRLDGGIR